MYQVTTICFWFTLRGTFKFPGSHDQLSEYNRHMDFSKLINWFLVYIHEWIHAKWWRWCLVARKRSSSNVALGAYLLSDVKLGTNTAEVGRKLCNVFGQTIATHRTTQNWLRTRGSETTPENEGRFRSRFPFEEVRLKEIIEVHYSLSCWKVVEIFGIRRRSLKETVTTLPIQKLYELNLTSFLFRQIKAVWTFVDTWHPSLSQARITEHHFWPIIFKVFYR